MTCEIIYLNIVEQKNFRPQTFAYESVQYIVQLLSGLTGFMFNQVSTASFRIDLIIFICQWIWQRVFTLRSSVKSGKKLYLVVIIRKIRKEAVLNKSVQLLSGLFG